MDDLNNPSPKIDLARLLSQSKAVFDLRIEEKENAVRLDSNTLIPLIEFVKLRELDFNRSIYLLTTIPTIEVRFTYTSDNISMGKYPITPRKFYELLLDLQAFCESHARNLNESITQATINFRNKYIQEL